jgi:hypothetical protein
MMEKNGRVEPGKTPSEVSGRKSETLKAGQAVRADEVPAENTVEKVAALVDN